MSGDKPHPGIDALRDKLGVRQVTGADIGPFLKMRPDAPLVVNIDNWLVPVRDVYYDNEMGLHVLEVDLGVDSKPATPQGQ